MTSEEFIERVHTIGYDVHLNDGVWWIKSDPFFYKPVVPMQMLEPGKVTPKLYKAILGYSHLVRDKQYANKYQSIALLNEEQLRNYSLLSLSSSKRAQVKKGLKLTLIRKIEDIGPVLDDIREIEISKAVRTGRGKPPEYYTKYRDKWSAWTIKQFNGDKGKKEYWGSFYKGLLIAYMKVFQINDTMIINYAASHTDHLDKCPNDALTYSIIDCCRELPECRQVSYGAWSTDRPSLNEFKNKFGFAREDLPVYAKYNFNIIPYVKTIIERKHLGFFKKHVISCLAQFKK
ncbi:MAG: hypothetical protein HZA16_03905 [Nitrospirae bacterium]|nr:hypothetical protein [Nitrospirota bacterium]